MDVYDVVVIGGGQAGLAAGYQLQRRGLRFVILEAGNQPTGSWAHYYDSLQLFSPARYSSLPGLPFPGDPDRYPARDEVIHYLATYADYFQLPIMCGALIEQIERRGNLFQIATTNQGNFAARAIVAATGAFSRPYMPQFEGQTEYSGQILHSSAYRNPGAWHGKRVLVVGAGNSAIQIAVELAKTSQVTLTSRQPVRFRRQRLLGRDIHFWARITGFDTWQRRFAGWSPDGMRQQAVLDTGVYQAAFASGNPAYRALFERFTSQGVVWADGTEAAFDAVILATGFQPNLPYLQALGALDEYGNAVQRGGISLSTPGLYYVGLSGQRSFSSATLRGVGDDAAFVTRHLARYLRQAAQREQERCCFNLRFGFSG
jgi:putative flavoprotein involved in K+ transport